MKQTAINALRKVKQKILKNPEVFDMSCYSNECGTVGCIAGHIVGIKKARKVDIEDMVPVSRLAAAKLGLDSGEAENLFFISYWPNKFFNPYVLGTTKEEKAKVTAKRIEYFIKYRK